MFDVVCMYFGGSLNSIIGFQYFNLISCMNYEAIFILD